MCKVEVDHFRKACEVESKEQLAKRLNILQDSFVSCAELFDGTELEEEANISAGNAIDDIHAEMLKFRKKIIKETEARIDANELSRMAEELGRKGGSAKSDAKAKAAAENGKKGGRPRNKTMMETLHILLDEDNKEINHELVELIGNKLSIEIKDGFAVTDEDMIIGEEWMKFYSVVELHEFLNKNGLLISK